MEPVVIWNPSDDGPKVWEVCRGERAAMCALAYVSGVCSSGSHVATVFDTGHSVVVISRKQLSAGGRMSRRILVEHVYPPIPIREFDWCATFAGYEPGEPQGYGPTRQAAIEDLMSSADELGEAA